MILKIYIGNQNNKKMYLDINNLSPIICFGHSGSGKTYYINKLLDELFITYKENEVKLILCDTKEIELFSYKDSKYLIYPIINKTPDFTKLINKLMSTDRDIKYPILIIIDEFYPLFKSIDDLVKVARNLKTKNIHMIATSQIKKLSYKNCNATTIIFTRDKDMSKLNINNNNLEMMTTID